MGCSIQNKMNDENMFVCMCVSVNIIRDNYVSVNWYTLTWVLLLDKVDVFT